MRDRNEDKGPPSNNGSRRYVVFVDDNFHHMDESERYKLGEFSSCEEATEACKKIVACAPYFQREHHLRGALQRVRARDCFFSAWDYAKKRCRELTARN